MSCCNLMLTTNYMLPPGFLSIIADIGGIIFVSLGGIPVLHRIRSRGRSMVCLESHDGVRLRTCLPELLSSSED